MAVPLGDSRADANSEKQLVVRDFSIKSLPGSFAIKVIVSAKGSLDMQFGTNLSGSAFVPGALDDGSAHDALAVVRLVEADGLELLHLAVRRIVAEAAVVPPRERIDERISEASDDGDLQALERG